MVSLTATLVLAYRTFCLRADAGGGTPNTLVPALAEKVEEIIHNS